MQLKTKKIKNCKNANRFLKCASLIILTLSAVIISLNTFIHSVKYEEIVHNFNTSVNKLLYHSAQENKIKAPSQAHKNTSLGSSINQSVEEDTKQNTSETLLYRKRRYLQFPEGSSFQLVFDLVLPIIDYTNYAILAVTCALAFELPSKPLSELEDDLIKKLKTVSHDTISRNDSAMNINYIDTHSYQKHIKDTFSDVIYVHPSEYANDKLYSRPKTHVKGNIKYIPGPYEPSYRKEKSLFYMPNHSFGHRYKEKFEAGKPVQSFWKPTRYGKIPHLRRQDDFPKRKQHAVYHIMGKRSIASNKPSAADDSNSWLNTLDKIHLRYHRSSRHALYSKIEAMFSRQGKNGTECVLRALCETGRRKHETEPGGLLTEILRAVFTLPEADTEVGYKNYHPTHKARDEAHWNQQNCSQAYPLCEDFIWNSHFKF